jgi:hypothetical protein
MDVLPARQLLRTAAREEEPSTHEFREGFRQSAGRAGAEQFAVVGDERAVIRAAQCMRLV